MVKLNRKLIILALFILIFYMSMMCVAADSFDDVQDKIDNTSSGDDVYLDNKTYVGSGNEISINKTLRIHGSTNSSKKSTLDAQKSSRIFNVTGNNNVSFINLVLINGKTTGNNNVGGAVHSSHYNSNLYFINCTFINSSTNGPNSPGGAIHSSGNVNVNGSSFINSSTKSNFSHGGVIYSGKSTNVINSSFINSSTNGPTSAGGAIYSGGSGSVNGSSFINSSTNGSSSHGGAIYYGGSVSVYGSSFINSSTNADWSRGGAINSGDSVSVYGSSFINSSTKRNNSRGGAIFSYTSVSVYGSSFINSSTKGSISHGGAIDSGSVSVINSSFINSSTNGNNSCGGVIHSSASVSVNDSSFINSSTNGPNSPGGAIHSGSVSVNGSSFINSSTSGPNSPGGAIHSGSVSVNGSSFINSSTSGSNSPGGAMYIYGMYVSGSNANVTNNKFNGSSATVNGGVIYNRANLYLKNNTMENSTVSTLNSGRDIYNENIVYIANLTYLDNTTRIVKYGQTIELWANITDDMGNTITGKNVTFIINGNSFSVEAIEGLAKLNFTANLSPGLYPVYGNYTGRGNNPIILRNGTLVIVDVELNVTKVSDKEVANVGDNVTYTITVVNTGSVAANNVTVSELIPNGLSLIDDSWNTSLWTKAGNVWSLVGALNGGSSAVLKLVFLVNGNTTGTVVNNVVVMSNETGNGTSNATNNNVSLNNVTLNVTKVSDKSVANVGDNVTYTITVVNTGSTSANNVTVTEWIPNGLSLIDDSWNTSLWTKAGNVWSLVGALNGGSSAVLKLVFLVNGNSTGTVVNNVVVMSNETGNGTVNATNNNVSLNNVTLNVTKVSDKSVANVGDNVTYTITVVNTGSTSANNVTVSELIPNGLVYVAYSNTTSNWVYSNGVWSLVGALNGGSSAVLKLVFLVNGNSTGTVVNNVVVMSNETGNGISNATNNNTTVTNVSLSVTKVSDKVVANVGDNVTYTITVVNVGSTSANGVSVRELIPSGLSLIDNSWNTSLWSRAGNVWSLVGALNGGSSATLKLIFRVNGKSIGTVVNDVVVRSSETGNGTSNATNNNVSLNNVTLRVTKVSDKSVANVGDKVTYIITVVNVGSTSANGVSVSELIPKGLTLINNSWNTNKWTKAGNVWTLVGALNGGSSATLKLIFRVNGKSIGTVVNNVVVRSSETGNGTSNATNNNVSLNNVTLRVTKVSDKSVANVGDKVTYIITVVNVGSTSANGVSVSELIPKGLTLINNSWNTNKWTKAGNVWTLVGALNGGSSATLKLVFLVNGKSNGTVVNDVLVMSNETGNGTVNATNNNVTLNVTNGSDRIVDNSTASNTNNYVYRGSIGMKPTGNPLAIFIMVIFVLFVPFRRFKK